MRPYFILIALTVMMAFATGYIALFLSDSYRATTEDIIEIAQLKSEFQKQVNPRYIINFNSLYHGREQFKLLNPIYSFAESHMADGTDYSKAENCYTSIRKLISYSRMEKVWMWEQFRCGQRNYLPKSFFEDPPFMHPSGQSYVYLAYQSGQARYKHRAWLQKHLNYIHALELKEMSQETGYLGELHQVLGGLPQDAYTKIIQGAGTILTKEYLLARLNYPSLKAKLEYRLYSRRDLESFLRRTPYSLHNYVMGESCFFKDGPLCWDYNMKHIFKLANTSSVILMLSFALILVLVSRLLWVKIKNDRFQEKKRRLALQVLSHEFRTPVTSLLLLSEQISNRFDQLDEQTQEDFLKLSSEVHRLHRLTETSRNYLSAKNDNNLVNFNLTKIESLNSYLDDVLHSLSAHYDGELIVQPSDFDTMLETDAYWLRICLKNLIENAFVHGQAPVEVCWKKEKDNIYISVKDGGQCQFETIEEMCGEFVKGPQSEGSGLGLNIVKKIIEEMGGQLVYRCRPTRFTIHLKQKPKLREKRFDLLSEALGLKLKS